MSLEDRCAAMFAADHPAEAGRRLSQLPFDASAAFLATLPTAAGSAVVSHMHATVAAACVAALPAETAAAFLGALTLDHAARIMRLLPAVAAGHVLARTDPARRERLLRALAYPERTAGAMMDPSAVATPLEGTIGDALRDLRRQPVGIYSYVYVVDRAECVVGALGTRELLAGEPKTPIADVMRSDFERVSPFTDLATLAALPAWLEMDAIPVVDREGRLLGAVRHRTVRRLTQTHPTIIRFDQLGTTLTRIGEIYWLTLGAMVAAAAGVVPAATPPASREGP